ncbi:hypothetical protein [Streptomyces sp. NBC_00663]|uniref:hypothetical protein n=1 Tax=Streptomyces sp. NBC_00663 TaxID=2975801 RepID=UPI002E36A279|nr:hypothetical protein [Streptomyces sp. NBC_00663]
MDRALTGDVRPLGRAAPPREAAGNYPAHWDLEYPEQLSRGLVLVKWWLLAVPQYLVLGIIMGGGGSCGRRAGSWDSSPSPRASPC